jgi:protein-disulfide isomerase
MNSKQNRREILRKKRINEKRQKGLKIGLIILAVILIFGAAALLPKLILEQSTDGIGRGFPLGDPNAPVTVVQFSSYSCGFCKDFSERVEKDFISDYVDPGLVFYRYVNIPSSNEDSQNAAKASYCAADQKKFYDYKDYLYTNASSVDGFSLNSLISYANSAGLAIDEFQACLEASTYNDAFVEDFRYAQSIGVTGTPTFLVNGQLVSSIDLIPFVDSLLAEN